MSVFWKHRRGTLRIGARPLVMGVLNVTPDSFSDGGSWSTVAEALQAALAMAAAGADIIDIGGESTRPGAPAVSTQEECDRVLPVIQALRECSGVVISIDTTKAQVARAALQAGADIVNDISGGTFEPAILEVSARAGAGFVASHTPGRPAVMNELANYSNVVEELLRFLGDAMERAAQAGLAADNVALDPGFGFGKERHHNYELLRNLGRFNALGRPLVVGVSRKRMIREVVGTDREALQAGTLAASTAAALQAPSVWRVHDVPAAIAAARVVGEIQGAE